MFINARHVEPTPGRKAGLAMIAPLKRRMMMGELGECGPMPPRQIQSGIDRVPCAQAPGYGSGCQGTVKVPHMIDNPAYFAWQTNCAAPVESSDPVKWIRATATRPDLPAGKYMRNENNKQEWVINGTPFGTMYFVPVEQNVGGGGTNKILPDGMLKAGGMQFNFPYLGDGYLFIANDPWNLPWGPTEAFSKYTPGIGSGLKENIVSLAPLFIAAGAAALLPAAGAAAGGTAATAGSAGAIMPGAAAVSSGATGGILATGGTAAAGGGLTAAEVIAGAKAAAGAVSAIGTVQKLVNQATTKANASNALMASAQQQADAGNLVAADQLYQQALANGQQSQAATAAANQVAHGFNLFGQQVSPMALAVVGGAALLLFVLARRKRK